MYKKIMLCLLVLLFCSKSFASPRQIPFFFAYQSYLIDEGGNPLPDGYTDIYFRIMDSVGNVLYEEKQQTEIIKGNANVIVGNGINPTTGAATGGVPLMALDPTDIKFLEVEVPGYKPYDKVEVVSSPYAVWADTALHMPDGAITSVMLGNKVITKEHLDSELYNAIFPDGGIPKAMLPSDTVYGAALQGSAGASKVGVTTAFIYSSSQTVQGVLKDLDLAINKRRQEIDLLTNSSNTNIGAETTARQAADAAEATARQGADAAEATARQNADSGEAAARLAGDSAEASARQAGDNAVSGVHGITGNVVGTGGAQTLTSKTLTSPTINGGNISNDVTVTDGKKIDGVDVSMQSIKAAAYIVIPPAGPNQFKAIVKKHFNFSTIVTFTGPVTYRVTFETPMSSDDYVVSSTFDGTDGNCCGYANVTIGGRNKYGFNFSGFDADGVGHPFEYAVHFIVWDY